MRAVGDVLREQANLEGKDRLIAVHGNRFILHLVFRVLNKFDSASQDEFEQMKKRIHRIALEMLASTTAEKEKQAKGSYPLTCSRIPANARHLRRLSFRQNRNQSECLDIMN